MLTGTTPVVVGGRTNTVVVPTGITPVVVGGCTNTVVV